MEKIIIKNKTFDNIIDVTENANVLHILNRDNTMDLTWIGKFVFEYVSSWPLIKIEYYNDYLYGYSKTHEKLIVLKRYYCHQKEKKDLVNIYY